MAREIEPVWIVDQDLALCLELGGVMEGYRGIVIPDGRGLAAAAADLRLDVVLPAVHPVCDDVLLLGYLRPTALGYGLAFTPRDFVRKIESALALRARRSARRS